MKFTSVLSGIFALLLIASACKKNDKPPTNNNATPDLKMVSDNLVSPVALVAPDDDSKRLFVVDQVGKIWVIRADGSMSSTPFMDISSKMVSLDPGYDERGLLGLAFHPDFRTNGKFYVFYSAPPHAGGPGPGSSWNSLTRISEFKVVADGSQTDMSSERVILEEDHPQSNHNGVNGQDIYANLLGNILRIDVDNGATYTIPADNPFVGTADRQEIYAYGFRNPCRFSFDMGGNHQLIVGNAGQSRYEEIDNVVKGGNYGWNVKEGSHNFSTDNDLTERPISGQPGPLGRLRQGL